MIARAGTVRGTPEMIDWSIRNTREKVLPALQAQSGYDGFLFLVNRETSTSIGITFWESREAERSSRGPLAHLLAESIQEFDLSTAQHQHVLYEVADRQQVETGSVEGMFARVTTFQEMTEPVDAAIERGKRAIRTVKEMGGFGGNILLADRRDGRILNVSFWDSQAALKENDERIGQLRRQALQEAGGSGTASVEFYEVAAHV